MSESSTARLYGFLLVECGFSAPVLFLWFSFNVWLPGHCTGNCWSEPYLLSGVIGDGPLLSAYSVFPWLLIVPLTPLFHLFDYLGSICAIRWLCGREEDCSVGCLGRHIFFVVVVGKGKKAERLFLNRGFSFHIRIWKHNTSPLWKKKSDEYGILLLHEQVLEGIFVFIWIECIWIFLKMSSN